MPPKSVHAIKKTIKSIYTTGEKKTISEALGEQETHVF